MHLAQRRINNVRPADDVLVGHDQWRTEADAVFGISDEQAAARTERCHASARHARDALIHDNALEETAALTAVREDVRWVELGECVVKQVAEVVGARD